MLLMNIIEIFLIKLSEEFPSSQEISFRERSLGTASNLQKNRTFRILSTQVPELFLRHSISRKQPFAFVRFPPGKQRKVQWTNMMFMIAAGSFVINQVNLSEQVVLQNKAN